MTYEYRRGQYVEHLRTCKVCVSTWSGPKYELNNEGHRLRPRYASVSQFCAEARRLLEAII